MKVRTTQGVALLEKETHRDVPDGNINAYLNSMNLGDGMGTKGNNEDMNESEEENDNGCPFQKKKKKKDKKAKKKKEDEQGGSTKREGMHRSMERTNGVNPQNQTGSDNFFCKETTS